MDLSNLDYPEPIVGREIFNVHDATKINAFQTCPRQFFYEYVLGWRPQVISVDLIFGAAIHLAIEHLLKLHGRVTGQDVIDANDIFFDSYREEISADRQFNEKANKQPEVATKLLVLWAQRHSNDPFEVLYTEVPGSVPIDDEHRVIFKIDAIVDHETWGITNLETKTTSQDSKAWRAQWNLAIQPKIYTHALYCNYDKEKVFGTLINGLVCRKLECDIIQIPISETPAMMLDFMWNLQYKIKEIEHNFQALAECSPDDEVMQAFPKRETSCTKWNRPCPYLDFCMTWSNPLAHCHTVQGGFEQRDWDPREMVKNAKHTLTEDGIQERKDDEQPEPV